MIINEEKCKIGIAELLLLAAVIVYFIGIRIWFPVCEVSGETIMACHWAGQMLKAMSVLLFVLAGLRVVIPDLCVGIGLDLGIGIASVLTLRIPGGVINICIMDGMRCAVTKTWTLIFGADFVVLVLADLILCCSERNKVKHSRSDGGKAA